MSLAEELLNDFAEDEELGDQLAEFETSNKTDLDMMSLDVGIIQQDLTRKLDALQQSVSDDPLTSLKSVCTLSESEELSNILSSINDFRSKQESGAAKYLATPGSVFSESEEYQLIISCNKLSVQIDNEINLVYSFSKDIYNKRFPELEQLIQNPIDYMKTIELLGNHLAVTKVDLTGLLPPATVMVVSVAASTTQAKPLDDISLETVMAASKMVYQLTEAQKRILEFVESFMFLMAPNLSNLIGTLIAAKLIGIAGGLHNLAKIPACNLQLLGVKKKTLAGFSTATVLPHTGFIYYSELVQNLPSDIKIRVARILAAKCSLASRTDAFNTSPSGVEGKKLREQVMKKIDKIVEPPPVKGTKPLPKPDDVPRKKRGGRRIRRMKEKYAITEVRKQSNRISFGHIEEDVYQTDLGFSVGTLGYKENSGKVRAPTINMRTQATLSKKLQREISKQQQMYAGGKSTVRSQISGTASSVAFTPLQGLEIYNPNAVEKIPQNKDRYFSSNSGFNFVKPPPRVTSNNNSNS